MRGGPWLRGSHESHDAAAVAGSPAHVPLCSQLWTAASATYTVRPFARAAGTLQGTRVQAFPVRATSGLYRACAEGRQWEGAHLPPRLLVLTRASTRERRGVGRWFAHYVKARVAVHIAFWQPAVAWIGAARRARMCARLFAWPEGKRHSGAGREATRLLDGKMSSIFLTCCDSKTSQYILRQAAASDQRGEECRPSRGLRWEHLSGTATRTRPRLGIGLILLRRHRQHQRQVQHGQR